MDYKFYDTSSLLLRAEDLFTKEEDEKIVISSITLKELENIKTSSSKGAEIKCAARHLLHMLDEAPISIVIYSESFEQFIKAQDLLLNDDMKILACAVYFEKKHPNEMTFITNDLSLKTIANLFFGEDSIQSIQ